MGMRTKRVMGHFLGWAVMGGAWPAMAGPGDPSVAARAAQAAQTGAPTGAAASTQPLGIALLGAGLFMFWLYARRKQNRS